jgi:hypothetical protein
VQRKRQHESPDAHHEQYNPVVVRGGDKSPKSSIHVGHNKRQRSDLSRAGEASEQFNETYDVLHEREGFDKVSRCLVWLADFQYITTDYIPSSCTHNTARTRCGSDSQRFGTATQQSAAKGTMSPEICVQSVTVEASICRQLSPRLDPHTQQFAALKGVWKRNLGGKVQQIGTRRQPVGDISAIAAEVDLDHGKKRPRVSRTGEYAGEESARDHEISVCCQLLCLPDDIQSIIFAKLPLANLYKLQTCCRQLRNITHFESFKQARVHEFPLERSYSPMFFSVHEDVLEMAGYDIDSGEWCPLPSLKCLPSSPDPGLLKEFLVAGAEGLLCINVGKAAASGAPKLIICNPLTQKTRELPAMNFPRHPVLMHLIVDTKKNSYKVIVAGSSTFGTEHLSRKTEVYCSETESWQETGDLPGPDFGLNEYQNGAYSDGVLYCVALSGDTSGKVVLAYHVAKGIWLPKWNCPIPTFRSNAYFATTQIVGLGGSIFVFSEQEYLKEVKFSIEKLEFVEMKSQKSQKERWRCNSEIPEHLEGSSEGARGARKQDQMWSTLMKNHTDPNSWKRVLTEKKVGKWTNLLQEPKQGSRGLMVYPEHTCVGQGNKNQLCIFNTVERSMIIHDLENNCHRTIQTTPLRKCKKKFHSLNPLAFTFTPNFNAAV